MVVQGSGERGQGSHRAVVDDLFQNARRMGARGGNPEDLQRTSRGGGGGGGGGGFPPSSSAFTGSSYTLSGDQVSDQQQQEEADRSEEPVMHTITFYRNGIFTVDDGAPRDVQDPANKDFIDSIGRGEVPREFDQMRTGEGDQQLPGGLARPPMQPVHVNLVSKMEEDYVPPAKPVAFTGQGFKLSDQSEGEEAAVRRANQESSTQQAAAAAATKPFELDETQPVTSIQLRLMDGTRMVARFNPSMHTIADIRQFINRARPGESQHFQLVTAFPTTVLDQEDKTIEELGLKNAVILAKLT